MYETTVKEETFNRRLIRAIENAFIPSRDEKLEASVQEESEEEHQALVRSSWLNDIPSLTHV